LILLDQRLHISLNLLIALLSGLQIFLQGCIPGFSIHELLFHYLELLQEFFFCLLVSEALLLVLPSFLLDELFVDDEVVLLDALRALK